MLPDIPGLGPLASSGALMEAEVVAYPSGRPWLVGRWAREELTVACAGSNLVAVIGSCPVTATRLGELIAAVRRVQDLDAVVRTLPGSAHMVASVDGVLRVQGSVTGLRRVFHARVSAVTVASDRADLLATLTGAGIDEQILATRVTCGGHLPPPLGEQSMWHGVLALPPDHYLRVERHGATTTPVRWWLPPVADEPLAAGAVAVREALQAAVAARRPCSDRTSAESPAMARVSADLSGGMDSTSLCFLAASLDTPDLLTFRWGESEAGNDDAVYAAQAIAALKGAEHLVLHPDDHPSVFDAPEQTGDPEAPYLFARTHSRTRHSAQMLASRGARTHLAGHGADELFHAPSTSHLYDLARRHPRVAFTHLRGYRALGRWPLGATLTALVDSRDMPTWWREQAAHLTDPPPARRSPSIGWGRPWRAAPWATPAALDAAREKLRATAAQALPLADQRGQHATLSTLRTMTPAYRQLARLFSTSGMRLELPYYDDRVVEAALAVRLHERNSPWRYKPLLAEAMHAILPPSIAQRGTKGEYGEDVRQGLRRNLPALLEVFTDSALAARGLIDPDVLRARLLAPQVDNSTVIALENLLGCEMWLRIATAATPTPQPPTALMEHR
ncbi:asparagine synthase-related protein [Streptomyces sp. NPDC018000]|uniref:asparagine synthase-related protein n=1 Tax=Streptomyces sp. NPDC018000 TaxID=3365028 RepID=UPI003795C388